MSNYSTLTLHSPRSGVTQITMSRPEVFNAFDEIMIGELGSAFDQLIADKEVRIIVLAGDGKHFSAGADLKWMQRASEESREWNLIDARRFAKMLAKIDRCPKPTIARVQGAALGGGTGLVCVCDIAIGADNASFAVSEAKFGIVPAVISPYLINTIGKRHARHLALTTSRIRAGEAQAIGLLHKVTSLDELDNLINSTIDEVLAGGPNAQREIKALFAEMEVGPVTDFVLDLTAQTISRVRGTDEAREGFSAFLDKRKANWIPD
jgi:methylglutaconyl-CoA hydratase